MQNRSPDQDASEPAPGLAMIRSAFAAGGFGRGIGRTLGIAGTEASAGRVVLSGSPNEDHFNPQGTVHGGYVATMLDAAAALALHTLLPAGTSYATTNLHIIYLRPLTEASGPLRAEGGVIQAGRSMALGEARLFDRKDQLCAHATATFVVKRGGAGEQPNAGGSTK